MLIEHLKKPAMAKEAQRLLGDTGWLPEPLRLLDVDDSEVSESGAAEDAALPDFLSDDAESLSDEVGEELNILAAE